MSVQLKKTPTAFVVGDAAIVNRADVPESVVLGDAAVRNVGTTAGTVAHGDHGHEIADTAGLQAALDGKVPVGSTYNISDVNGLQDALDAKRDDGAVISADALNAIVGGSDGLPYLSQESLGGGAPIPGGPPTPEEVRDALESLEAGDRLSAAAIRDLPSLQGVLWGSGAPDNSLGFDGDTYIDSVGAAIYGPKASGVWPAPLVLLGDLVLDDISDFPQILTDLGTAADEAARLAVLGITDDPWTDGALRIGNASGGADDITIAELKTELDIPPDSTPAWYSSYANLAAFEAALTYPDLTGYATESWVTTQIGALPTSPFDDETAAASLGILFAELDSADQTTGSDETLAWSASTPEDRLTVTASIDILNATGFDGKGAHILTVIQDATGGRAITFNATNFEAHNGADLTENDAANAITVYVLLDVGTSKIQVFKAG